ncbi:hypothetical protein PCASD_22239 [Puccinia coronata f. sp. avenae]|uniref:Uncharacterized protein n=1 Tax=Puccinia coronata f. sp. avenae TaxID=200324 RepID=A0A2N5TQZ1_9BASI|nr:hypothetical protein PCASD_22239 [Puccinia coronata f. sp. avenae]
MPPIVNHGHWESGGPSSQTPRCTGTVPTGQLPSTGDAGARRAREPLLVVSDLGASRRHPSFGRNSLVLAEWGETM